MARSVSRVIVFSRIVAAFFLFLTSAALAEDVWCSECDGKRGAWVERDMSFDEGKMCPVCKKGEFCRDCGGIFTVCNCAKEQCPICEGWDKPGSHDCKKYKCSQCGEIFLKPAASEDPVLCRKCFEPAHDPVLQENTGDSVLTSDSGNTGNVPSSLQTPQRWWDKPLDFVLKHILSVGVIAFAIFIILFFAAAVKSAKKAAAARFVFVKGKPQGIELIRDELVCSAKTVGSEVGGTAEGRPALVFKDRKWTPAFVKRMIGNGMREEMRRPVLEFESSVLKRLQGTGCAPELLYDVADVKLDSGENWMYFVMSVAGGTPWPLRGGLGKHTRRALYALCEALAKLHDRGVGHHDLKPQNIFYEEQSGTITLLDFGSAIDHKGDLVNPLGNTYPKTVPWVAPPNDGKRLAELSIKSDSFVYGLIFCEAILECIHCATAAARKSATNNVDRDWIKNALSEKLSPKIANAVVDGLLALEVNRRMNMADFLQILAEEWKEEQ